MKKMTFEFDLNKSESNKVEKTRIISVRPSRKEEVQLYES